MKTFNISLNRDITDLSAPVIKEIAEKTGIMEMKVNGTSMSHNIQQEINQLFGISCDAREIPISSNAKSASKIS